MSVPKPIGALFLVLLLVAGLLMAIGSISARERGGQAVFLAGWSLVFISSLTLVQNY